MKNPRWLLAKILLVWAVSGVINETVALKRWWWLSAPCGFFGVTIPHSLTMKMVTGKWPPWRKVWRMFAHGEIPGVKPE